MCCVLLHVHLSPAAADVDCRCHPSAVVHADCSSYYYYYWRDRRGRRLESESSEAERRNLRCRTAFSSQGEYTECACTEAAANGNYCAKWYCEEDSGAGLEAEATGNYAWYFYGYYYTSGFSAPEFEWSVCRCWACFACRESECDKAPFVSNPLRPPPPSPLYQPCTEQKFALMLMLVYEGTSVSRRVIAVFTAHPGKVLCKVIPHTMSESSRCHRVAARRRQ